MIGSAVATRSLRIRASEAASWATLATLVHDISSSFFLSSHAATGAVERRVLACVCLCLFLSFLPSCSKTSFFLCYFTNSSILAEEHGELLSRRFFAQLSYRPRRRIVQEQSSHNDALYTNQFVVTVTSRIAEGPLGYRLTDQRVENRRGGCTTLDLRTTTSCWKQTTSHEPRSDSAPTTCAEERHLEWEIPAKRVLNSGCGNRAIYGKPERVSRGQTRLYLPSLENVESKVDIDSNSPIRHCFINI